MILLGVFFYCIYFTLEPKLLNSCSAYFYLICVSHTPHTLVLLFVFEFNLLPV